MQQKHLCSPQISGYQYLPLQGTPRHTCRQLSLGDTRRRSPSHELCKPSPPQRSAAYRFPKIREPTNNRNHLRNRPSQHLHESPREHRRRLAKVLQSRRGQHPLRPQRVQRCHYHKWGALTILGYPQHKRGLLLQRRNIAFYQ